MRRMTVTTANLRVPPSPAAFSQNSRHSADARAALGPYLTSVSPAPVSVTGVTAALPRPVHRWHHAWRPPIVALELPVMTYA